MAWIRSQSKHGTSRFNEAAAVMPRKMGKPDVIMTGAFKLQ